MKFYSAIALPLLQVASASAAAIEIRQTTGPSQETCVIAVKEEGIYNNAYSQACVGLISDCLAQTNVTTDLWSVNSCVAAATCDGTANLITLAQCRNNAVPSAANLPHLDYNIYAGIVGNCAWQTGGCPITTQNYIDFIYGALTSIGSTFWPESADQAVQTWWDPITSWTQTGDSVPYTNFDDWLHYSS